jgi:hypothetical protein
VEVCGSICVHGTAFFFCGAREYKISKEVVEQVDENGVPQV